MSLPPPLPSVPSPDDVLTVRLPLIPGQQPSPLRNRALLQAGKPWVFLLDSDAEPAPGCLAALCRALSRCPKADVVLPRVLSPAGQDPEQGIGSCHFLGEICFAGPPRSGQPSEDVEPLPAVASSTAFLVRREAALSCLFDEELGFGREDLDFFLRLRAAGRRLIRAPEAVVLHHRRRVLRPGDLRLRRTYFQTRNRWLALAKVMDARTLWLTSPLQLAYEALRLGHSVLQGEAAEHLRGLCGAVLAIPRILESRRSFFPRKSVPDRALFSSGRFSWTPRMMELPGAGRLKSALELLCAAWWRMISPLLRVEHSRDRRHPLQIGSGRAVRILEAEKASKKG